MQFLIQLRPTLRLLGALAGLFPAVLSSAAPQPQSISPQAPSSSERPQSEVELPRVLILVQRPTRITSQRNDLLPRFIETLETALTDSKKFEVLMYSPKKPSIVRAMLEKRLAVADTVEPIKPEALGRIAHSIGAHTALLLAPTFDRQGFASDLYLLSDGEVNQWRIAMQDRISVENIQGKRRLNPTAVIALAVDSITGRMGARSHLAEGLKIAPDREIRLQPRPRHEETAKAKPANEADKKPDSSAKPTGTGAVAVEPPSSSQQEAIAARGKEKTAGKSARVKPSGGEASPSGAVPSAPPHEIATTTARPSADETSTENQAPAARPDYAGMAQRYQASGDLASAILFWRHAVDGDPYDVSLRRHLIQAYVDRHLPDAARSEATRSLTLLPEDPTLIHLYADTLTAGGDVAGALKVYRDLAHRAPKDVTVQVGLADALLADNQFSAAIEAYQTAAQIDVHSPLPHRRLARVYVGLAESDLPQYAASLKEINQARSLTPAGDTSAYETDYVPLMLRLDTRLHDLTGTLQNLYEAAVQGKKTTTELLRATTDLRERVTALADYLDALPPAAGLDEAHAHYTQAAALLLQGVGTFRHYLTASNVNLEDARSPMQVARMDVIGALNQAGKRLAAAHGGGKGAASP